MKKNLLITLDYPPELGGVAYYLATLYKHLPNKSVTVVAPPDPLSREYDPQQQYKIIRKKILSDYFWPRWLFFIPQLIKIIKQEEIEIITVGQLLPIGTMALIIKKLLNIPYIVSTHAMDVTILKEMPRRRLLAKKILKNAEKIITVSLYTKKELLKFGASHQAIEIISPATNILNRKGRATVDEIKNKYQLGGRTVIFSLGRLIERKGFDTVIKSLPQVLKKHPQVVYLIGSQGEYRPQLEQLIKDLNLAKNVLLVGEISTYDLPAYYQSCDIFIMVSRELPNKDVEGFGIVYLEAGAFGKPVIAGQSGGVGDAVRHNYNGLLVNPESTSETAQAMIRLIENPPLRESLGKNGLTMVQNNYTWPERANRLMKILS